MRLYTELLFIGLFLIQRSLCTCDNVSGPKIAIIGAGIGGASTAHFLTELFHQNVEIDIFERQEIGGRLTAVKVGDKKYEAGGSVIHPGNKYMNDFVKLLRLNKKSTSRMMKFAVWNGDKIVFAGNDAETMANIYEKGNVSKLFRTVNSFLDNFGNIYVAQDNGLAYENVNDLISAMNPTFPRLLQVSNAEYFHSLGLSNKTIDELIAASLIENYGQGTDIHSFVGLISLAGAGATAGGGLWAVKGGNKEVPIKLIHTNPRVNVKLWRVKEIRYLLNEEFRTQYEISYGGISGDIDEIKNIYDIVIIAAPMMADQEERIEFVGFPDNFNPLIPGNYKVNWKTFVKAVINPKHFTSEELNESIGTIISCNPNRTLINSISKQMPVDGSTDIEFAVWKISSTNRLPDHLLHSMFSNLKQYGPLVMWDAYPQYSTTPRSDKFELFDSLYHVNAIEWAASAMEMSAIGGRNVALLIHRKFVSRCRDYTIREQ